MMSTAMMPAAAIPTVSPLAAPSLGTLVGFDPATVGVVLVALATAVIARWAARRLSSLGSVADVVHAVA